MKSVRDLDPEDFKATPQDRELIIGTMRRWLNGEPVWTRDELLERWGTEFLMYRWAQGVEDKPTRYGLYELRQEWIDQFGFAIPSAELLDALARHQPIIEVGAGSGYMTLLMRHRGIDVIGTDPGPGQRSRPLAEFDPEQELMQAKTAVRRYPDRTVFCSWPSLDLTWFRQALRAMRIGQRLIYIKEDATAEETADIYLDQSFEREPRIPLPAWPMMNDRAAVYRKKRHAPWTKVNPEK